MLSRPMFILLSLLTFGNAANDAFLAAEKANVSVASSASPAQLAKDVTSFALSTQFALVEQAGARFPVGSNVRLFVLGSSNVLWNTWVDQLHLLLNQLGYASPVVDPQGRVNRTRPLSQARCDDHELHRALHTQRIGKPGWSSWGFSFESMDDCNAQGYRRILGHDVSCTNSWQCENRFIGPDPLVKPSQIARIADNSEVTVLSNWVNDFTARFSGNLCFNGEFIPQDDASLTIDSLLRTIRAIHARNPKVVVVVMARYPGAGGRKVASDPTAINAAVRAGIAAEPNTLFADFSFPKGEDMYLTSRSGHPNCRGDKVMATAVIEALFQARILGRGLDMGAKSQCLASARCETLSRSCCQRAALCWPRTDGVCVAYSPGEE